MKHYLPVDVLIHKDFADCSNNGISVTADRLLMEIPNGHITDDDIEKMRKDGLDVRVLKVMPPAFKDCPVRVCEDSKDGTHRMAGGNYVTSCDSQYAAVYKYPISIHDRIEVEVCDIYV